MGRREEGLKRLLASHSSHDDDRTANLKRALRENWRDWKKCRGIAGKLGAHHSVFEHLARDPRDYGGAFRRVSSRVRLIHLFAYQSHLWNRVVAEFLRERLERDVLLEVAGIEGPLVFPGQGFQVTQGANYSVRLPGPHLADVEDSQQKRLFEEVLRSEGLSKKSFNIEGIPGFGLKGEDRTLFVFPTLGPIRGDQGKKATSAGSRREGADRATVKLRFSLPRGAYATIVVKRLLASTEPAKETKRPGRKPYRKKSVSGSPWPNSRQSSDSRTPRGDQSGAKPSRMSETQDKVQPWGSGSRKRTDSSQSHKPKHD